MWLSRVCGCRGNQALHSCLHEALFNLEKESSTSSSPSPTTTSTPQTPSIFIISSSDGKVYFTLIDLPFIYSPQVKTEIELNPLTPSSTFIHPASSFLSSLIHLHSLLHSLLISLFLSNFAYFISSSRLLFFISLLNSSLLQNLPLKTPDKGSSSRSSHF